MLTHTIHYIIYIILYYNYHIYVPFKSEIKRLLSASIISPIWPKLKIEYLQKSVRLLRYCSSLSLKMCLQMLVSSLVFIFCFKTAVFSFSKQHSFTVVKMILLFSALLHRTCISELWLTVPCRCRHASVYCLHW